VQKRHEEIPTGCYIDGSSGTTIQFMLDVITMASNLGFKVPEYELEYVSEYLETENDNKVKYWDLVEWAEYYSDKAIIWMNKRSAPHFMWEMKDRKLNLMRTGE
jgi:hypothetical protein